MEEKQKKNNRMVQMLLGNFLIGIAVSGYRLAGFGVDPFTAMNLAISQYIDWLFGTWQLTINAVLLVATFFLVRRCIGIGTIINMAGIGYLSDFVCWLVQEEWNVPIGLPTRIILFIVSQIVCALGVAFYMVADMGISPYDSIPLMLEKLTHGKLPFLIARVSTDVTVVVVGIVFCIIGKHSIFTILGIATISNAVLNGPMIQFFKKWISGSDSNTEEQEVARFLEET